MGDSNRLYELDHIILLLSYKELINPPSWLTSDFTITPGGRHADGKTENKLIIFQDGTYIELIAFVDDKPKNRQGHWWGDKDYGFIDYALTSSSSATASDAYLDAVRQRVERVGFATSQENKHHEDHQDTEHVEPRFPPSSVARYAEPQEGGRTRADGKVVRWRVTFPTGVARGQIPFWCQDLTPRELRVPLADEAATRHPCGALGVAGLTVLVPERVMDGLRELNGAVVDQEYVRENHDSAWSWELGVPRTKTGTVRVCLDALTEEEEWRGVAIESVGLRTADGTVKTPMA